MGGRAGSSRGTVPPQWVCLDLTTFERDAMGTCSGCNGFSIASRGTNTQFLLFYRKALAVYTSFQLWIAPVLYDIHYRS